MSNIQRSPINWVVCAAGKGSRFSHLHISKPKPQIKLNEFSFLTQSLKSLPFIEADNLIIITLKGNNTQSLEPELKEEFKKINIQWVELDSLTRGQLETFYFAKDKLDANMPTAIWNCDTYFKSQQFSSDLSDNSIDGIIPCGKMPGEHWSFCQVDQSHYVINIVEKTRISDWCTVGLYHFRNTKRLLKETEEYLKEKPVDGQKEYYVSGLYKVYLKNKAKLKISPVEVFLPFGTPEEVTKYWNISLDELKQKNEQ